MGGGGSSKLSVIRVIDKTTSFHFHLPSSHDRCSSGKFPTN